MRGIVEVGILWSKTGKIFHIFYILKLKPCELYNREFDVMGITSMALQKLIINTQTKVLISLDIEMDQV